MKDTKHQLRKELLAAGASEAEAQELLLTASQLSLLKGRSAAAANDQVKPTRWLRIIKPLTYVTAGLVLGMFLVIISQAALPTSALYPVQRFSDSIAIDIHPGYRANVMMKRAQQVNELVASHAGSEQVLATLADYTKEASAYKATSHANYAAFEYCKNNLQQAAVTAPPAVSQAITSSLQAFETI